MRLLLQGYDIILIGTAIAGALGCLYLLRAWRCVASVTTYRRIATALGGSLYGIVCIALHGHAVSPMITVSTILFGLTLLYGAAIDKRYYILPDEGALCIGIVGLLRCYWYDTAYLDVGIVLVIVGSVGYMLRRLSRGGMGEGDIKWVLAISVWLTPLELSYTMILACTAGLVWGLHNRRRYIPFGPFLCTATWCVYCFQSVVKAYR